MKVIRRSRKRWLYPFVALILVGSYGYWAIKRPLPLLKPTASVTRLSVQTPASKLVWPATGQAAVGIEGSSIIEAPGKQTALPTASTAKLITALSVLRQKPLKLGEQGPIITLDANDVALYNSYAAQNGSVVPVVVGEQISEYQILQTMLLPSANNMADSLAIWAFGSLPAYSNFANSYVVQLGLHQTHIGADASGFQPSTVSSAHDLVKIGELAMQNPVLAQIVSQPTASGIPVVNTIKNVNFLLGTSDIIGVKTGNTDQAGGVYVSASRVTIDNKPVTIVTALTGSPSLFQALKDSLPLIQSAQTNFGLAPVAITSGAIVGHYLLPWGYSIPAVASKDLSVNTWKGSTLAATIHLRDISAKTSASQTVGSLTVANSALASQQAIPIQLSATPSQPTIWWRLLHP